MTESATPDIEAPEASSDPGYGQPMSRRSPIGSPYAHLGAKTYSMSLGSGSARSMRADGWGSTCPPNMEETKLPTLYQSAIYEELVRAQAPLPIGVVGLDVMAPTLVRHGSADQKAALLPPIL